MNYKFETVIGIEVHIELNTNSKMFCGCSTDYFGKEPNTQTCPVCLGLPGALPFINKEAIQKCIQIGLALNCQINPISFFERKNYFYPDLAKGYQISQLVKPLCISGWLNIESKDGQIKKIRINRVHQEEDTAKLTHRGTETLIDYNRSSVPLVEIVTEPDFRDSGEVRDYAKKLQQILRYLGVSNADMERGDMRLEANVSVRPKGQIKLPAYRVELKNINSFRFMVAAIEYEVKRQIEALEKGEKLAQETRGYNEEKRQTYTQRSKEEAHDYRYFPEPDLPEIRYQTSDISLEDVKKAMPELPYNKVARYVSEFRIKKADALILSASKELASFFERAVGYGKDKNVTAQSVANYIVNQKIDLVDSNPEEVVDDIVVKSVGIIDDEVRLEKLTKEVIDENPQYVQIYKSGKTTIIQALLGGVMRKSAGGANAQKALILLERLLH